MLEPKTQAIGGGRAPVLLAIGFRLHMGNHERNLSAFAGIPRNSGWPEADRSRRALYAEGTEHDAAVDGADDLADGEVARCTFDGVEGRAAGGAADGTDFGGGAYNQHEFGRRTQNGERRAAYVDRIHPQARASSEA